MSGFNEAITSIKERFFTFEEFPLVERGRFPRNCIKRAMTIDEYKVAAYALALTGKEVEALMLELTTSVDLAEIKRAVNIVCLRSSRRIIKLTTMLCQYNYDAQGVKLLCSEIVDADSNGNIPRESFLGKFGKAEDKIAVFTEAVLEEGQDIHAVYLKYGILEESPMAMEGSYSFFGTCEKTAFLMNCRLMIKLMEQYSKVKLTSILTNYLESLSVAEYNDNINLVILDKLGEPYVSPDWEAYDSHLWDKFAQWNYLYKLKLHCKDRPEKFHVLVKYYGQVRTNYTICDDSVLITDFGWLIMADEKECEDGYLYDRSFFEKEMAEWKSDPERVPTFLKKNWGILTAREYMLSTEDAPCIKFTFRGIHRYYIQEILDIKLNLEPDMRSIHVKKRK